MKVTRRDLLAGGAALLASRPLAALASDVEADGGDFMFVHITDTHLFEGMDSERWCRECLRQISELRPRPRFIVHGGDIVNGGRERGVGEVEKLFRMWQDVAGETDIPLLLTMGNHDMAATVGAARAEGDPGFGKGLYRRVLGDGRTYRSFDMGAVFVAVLDTFELKPDGGYRGFVDGEQLAWLDEELGKVSREKPIVLSVHVPLFTIVPQYDAGVTVPVPDWQVIQNGKDLKAVIDRHPVRVVLQGHTHVVEECRYMGVSYLTGGAVSGNWWNGSRFGVHEPGYAVVRVASDGALWSYRGYGWRSGG